MSGPDGLYVDARGPLGGTPIVFLHPSGSNATAWQPHLDALASRHRCLAVDLTAVFSAHAHRLGNAPAV